MQTVVRQYKNNVNFGAKVPYIPKASPEVRQVVDEFIRESETLKTRVLRNADRVSCPSGIAIISSIFSFSANVPPFWAACAAIGASAFVSPAFLAWEKTTHQAALRNSGQLIEKLIEKGFKRPEIESGVLKYLDKREGIIPVLARKICKNSDTYGEVEEKVNSSIGFHIKRTDPEIQEMHSLILKKQEERTLLVEPLNLEIKQLDSKIDKRTEARRLDYE